MAGGDAEVGRDGDKATREWKESPEELEGNGIEGFQEKLCLLRTFAKRHVCSILKQSKAKEEFNFTKGSQRKSSQLGRIITSRSARCH